MTFVLRLAATLFFVFVNGFFVAAEFALVKVQVTQLRERSKRSRRARVAYHIRSHLDMYLSACQLGITLASLILGWLAEPAVAELLLWAAGSAGLALDPGNVWVHAIALALALSVVTFLHMTLGEQAPKIWAINRAESVALQVARPLQLFAAAFRPFIWVINESSNGLLRIAGMSPDELGDSSHNVEELRNILAASAEAGHISDQQLELAENVFAMIELEVRHILVPRVDVAYLVSRSPPGGEPRRPSGERPLALPTLRGRPGYRGRLHPCEGGPGGGGGRADHRPAVARAAPALRARHPAAGSIDRPDAADPKSLRRGRRRARHLGGAGVPRGRHRGDRGPDRGRIRPASGDRAECGG